MNYLNLMYCVIDSSSFSKYKEEFLFDLVEYKY